MTVLYEVYIVSLERSGNTTFSKGFGVFLPFTALPSPPTCTYNFYVVAFVLDFDDHYLSTNGSKYSRMDQVKFFNPFMHNVVKWPNIL